LQGPGASPYSQNSLFGNILDSDQKEKENILGTEKRQIKRQTVIIDLDHT